MESSSRIRDSIDAGRIAVGAFHMLAEPALVEIAARAGFDYVMLDYEHGMRDPSKIAKAVRAGRAAGIDVLVRITLADTGLVGRLLDEGATGVVVAHVRNAKDIEPVVNEAYYAPLGKRGSNMTMARMIRQPEALVKAAEAANRNTLVIAIIENEDGVAAVREIAAARGVSGISAGRVDLTFAAALSGAPEGTVDRQADSVVEAARASPGCFIFGSARPGDAQSLAAAQASGVATVMYGTDTAILENAYRQIVTEARRQIEKG